MQNPTSRTPIIFFMFSLVFLFFPLFRVVLLGFLLPFGRCCCFSFSFWWCCLPSPPLSGAAFSSSFVGWCWFLFCGFAVFPSPVWWCCLPSPPLGGAIFPLSSVGWCCLSPPSLGGVAVFLRPTQRRGRPSITQQKRGKNSSSTHGGEGRQHHQKGEGKNSNTTQRKRKPSSTTQQKRGRTQPGRMPPMSLDLGREGVNPSPSSVPKHKPRKKEKKTEKMKKKTSSLPFLNYIGCFVFFSIFSFL